MAERLNIHERRRNAFAHYFARAENARACAWTLHHAGDFLPASELATHPHGTDNAHARHEGFIREASIALELVLKAALCVRIEAGERSADVPLTHDIPQLWREAGIPYPQDRADRHNLQRVRVALMWSGRYPTARSAEQAEKDLGALQVDAEQLMQGTLRIYRHAPFGWEDFSRLYTAVLVKIGELERRTPGRL